MPRGGYRVGAGRKPLPAEERLTLVHCRLTQDQIRILRALGGGSFTRGLRLALGWVAERIGNYDTNGKEV